MVHYLSLDVEGAEDLILPHLPFNKHTFYVLTVERPSELGLKILSLNGYTLKSVSWEISVTIDCIYWDTTCGNASLPRSDQVDVGE